MSLKASKLTWASVLCLGGLSTLQCAAEFSLEEAFASPAADMTRPGVQLSLDVLPDGVAVDRQLERVRQAGAGGVLVSVPTPDGSVWSRIAHVTTRANELGLEVGFCDFPQASERTQTNSVARALQWTVDSYSNGVAAATNTVPQPAPARGALPLASLAVPEGAPRLQPYDIVDLARGSVPTSGLWQVYRFTLAPCSPAIPDALDSQTLFRHVNRFLSESQDRLSQAYGSTFLWYQFSGPPSDALVWPRDLPDLFLKRSGLSLSRYLPAVAGVPVGDAATADYVRQQLRLTLTEAWRSRFGRNVNEWVHEAGLDAGIRIDQVPVDPEEVALYFRRPMIVWNGGGSEDGRNVRASGGARAMGRRYVVGSLCPSKVGRSAAAPLLPFQWKPAADQLFAEGVTRLMVEMPVGLPADDVAFRELQAGLQYVHRCQLVLQHGRPVADFLVWSGSVFTQLQGYSCDYANGTVLATGLVKDGRIRFDSDQSYEALAVSSAVLGDERSARLVKQIAARGVKVKLVPVEGAESVVRSELCSTSIGTPAPDFTWQSDVADMRLSFVHRRTHAQEIYFLVNGSAAAATVACSFRDVGTGVLSKWDPLNGGRDSVEEARKSDDGRVCASLFFAPYEACFAVFDR